ncbi:uncharacterized protein [Antedon mediterranea]|uniref:uncharacterized protein n=1 Tax=Antedon mediterranea TaxID=105859 RepID=UPI003AF8A8B0
MKYTLIVFAVALFVAGAGAIDCYDCQECSTPKNSITCPENQLLGEFVCGLAVSGDRKDRTCLAKSACDLLSPKCDDDTQTNCFTCCSDKDNCNSSAIVGINLLTVVSVVLISLFFSRQ